MNVNDNGHTEGRISRANRLDKCADALRLYAKSLRGEIANHSSVDLWDFFITNFEPAMNVRVLTEEQIENYKKWLLDS